MNTMQEALSFSDRRRDTALRLVPICLAAITVVSGCGGGSSSATTSTGTSSSGSSSSSSSASTDYASAYNAADWGDTVTISFPSACEMTITTTGRPNYTPNPYYLAPASGSQTVVAYTSVTNMPLALISYADVIEPSLKGSSITVNACPTVASTSTATNLGAIGYLISGSAMFNPYEMNATTPALSDNASYSFTDSSGNAQTAYFIDQCNSHSNGTTWHAHGNPGCVTSQIDTSTGASHIIGVALDGFPIYGGRDINGDIVSVSQLDACNGITSPTPEFPNGAYHYVLPSGVTSKYSSINCFSGTVSQSTLNAAKKLAVNMKAMFAMIESKEEHQAIGKPIAMADDATTMPIDEVAHPTNVNALRIGQARQVGRTLARIAPE